MNFAHLQYWPWLLGVPACLVLVYFLFVKGKRNLQFWFGKDFPIQFLLISKSISRGLCLICALIALLGPYWGQKEDIVDILGREIYILVDVSGSMTSQDIAPSRLSKVKEELKALIKDLRGDKIGIIVFSDHAYVQCPLTQDYQAAMLFLEMASPKQFVQNGTQYRNVLVNAMDRFSQSQGNSINTSKVIVLASDGEDYGDTYISLFDRLKRMNIRVFPIGVGTPEGGPIPGRANGSYKKNSDGELIISKMNQESLKQVADYFETPLYTLDNDQASLKGLAKEILSISSTPFASRLEQVKNNKYQIFLLLSIVFGLFTLFLAPFRK